MTSDARIDLVTRVMQAHYHQGGSLVADDDWVLIEMCAIITDDQAANIFPRTLCEVDRILDSFAMYCISQMCYLESNEAREEVKLMFFWRRNEISCHAASSKHKVQKLISCRNAEAEKDLSMLVNLSVHVCVKAYPDHAGSGLVSGTRQCTPETSKPPRENLSASTQQPLVGKQQCDLLEYLNDVHCASRWPDNLFHAATKILCNSVEIHVDRPPEAPPVSVPMTGLGGRLQKKLGSIEKACLAYQKIPSDDNFSRVAKTFYNAARKGVHGQRGITEFAHVVRVKSGRDVLQQLRASRKPLPPEVIREMAAIMCDPNAGTLQPKYYNEVNTICEGIVEYCERNGLPIESQQVRNMIEEKSFNDTGKELTKAQANQRAALNARGVHSASELSHLAVGHILDEVQYLDNTKISEGGRLLAENAKKKMTVVGIFPDRARSYLKRIENNTLLLQMSRCDFSRSTRGQITEHVVRYGI